MIATLALMALTGWSCWLMHHAGRSAQATPTTKATPRAPHRALASGLEDDPVQWPGARGSWTALDERQLVRLLTNAAPGHTPP
jgi:hypothetical protein